MCLRKSLKISKMSENLMSTYGYRGLPVPIGTASTNFGKAKFKSARNARSAGSVVKNLLIRTGYTFIYPPSIVSTEIFR